MIFYGKFNCAAMICHGFNEVQMPFVEVEINTHPDNLRDAYTDGENTSAETKI